MKGIDDAARELAAVFERLGVRYAVMGGLAVRVHAIPRPTFDVDFTAAIHPSELEHFYREAEALGYIIPDAQRTGWVDRVRGLPVVKLQLAIGSRSIDLDIFLAETPFQDSVLSRRILVEADGWSAWFVTAEDLILLKLLADRPKDHIDIADTLFIQGTVDVSYMRKWADELGLVHQLDQAFANAGL